MTFPLVSIYITVTISLETNTKGKVTGRMEIIEQFQFVQYVFLQLYNFL
jgi:hypothetical protein